MVEMEYSLIACMFCEPTYPLVQQKNRRENTNNKTVLKLNFAGFVFLSSQDNQEKKIKIHCRIESLHVYELQPPTAPISGLKQLPVRWEVLILLLQKLFHFV